MVRQLNKALDEVISCIISTDEYQKCMQIKEKMSHNLELVGLIEEIKKLQKQYVNTNSEEVLEKVKELEKKLNDIPIYVIYMQYLDNVNEKISFINDSLNDYFYKLFNN